MKMTNSTITALKNFAAINPSVVIRPGNTQLTISVDETIAAEAVTEDVFPQECAIYDLNSFLNTLALFSDDFELEFGENSVKISDSSGATCNYVYASRDIVTTFPGDQMPQIPDVVLTFDLTRETIEKLNKAANVMQLNVVTIRNVGDQLTIGVYNKRSKDTNNSYFIPVAPAAECENDDFEVCIRADQLKKLLPGDYTVEISKRHVSRWVGNNNMKYIVALEDTSTYNK